MNLLGMYGSGQAPGAPLDDNPFTQADSLRLQQLQQGLSAAQRQVDEGVLHPFEGQQLTGRIQQLRAPLLLRQQAAQQKAQQRQAQELMHQSALAESIQQAHAQAQAESFNRTVASFTEPLSGQTAHFFQGRRGQWEQVQLPPDLRMEHDRDTLLGSAAHGGAEGAADNVETVQLPGQDTMPVGQPGTTDGPEPAGYEVLPLAMGALEASGRGNVPAGGDWAPPPVGNLAAPAAAAGAAVETGGGDWAPGTPQAPEEWRSGGGTWPEEAPGAAAGDTGGGTWQEQRYLGGIPVDSNGEPTLAWLQSLGDRPGALPRGTTQSPSYDVGGKTYAEAQAMAAQRLPQQTAMLAQRHNIEGYNLAQQQQAQQQAQRQQALQRPQAPEPPLPAIEITPHEEAVLLARARRLAPRVVLPPGGVQNRQQAQWVQAQALDRQKAIQQHVSHWSQALLASKRYDRNIALQAAEHRRQAAERAALVGQRSGGTDERLALRIAHQKDMLQQRQADKKADKEAAVKKEADFRQQASKANLEFLADLAKKHPEWTQDEREAEAHRRTGKHMQTVREHGAAPAAAQPQQRPAAPAGQPQQRLAMPAGQPSEADLAAMDKLTKDIAARRKKRAEK